MSFSELDRDARGRLRTLSKDNAETVGRHLVMVARLIDVDPETAYEHATAAVARGGRVDIVREAAGLCAYRTGRYAEALRELRTVRRLNGSSEHLPIMADCERGLGRPERAIALAATPEVEELDPQAKAELDIVVSGARGDLGEMDAALATLDSIDLKPLERTSVVRIGLARASVLEALGRPEDAAAATAAFSAEEIAEAQGEPGEEPVVVYDLVEDEAYALPEAEAPAGAVVDASAESSDDATDDAEDETSEDETSEDETSEDETSEDETPGGAPAQDARSQADDEASTDASDEATGEDR